MELADAIEAAAIGVGCILDAAQNARLEQYARLVFKWNRIANLTGAADPAAFVSRHLADSLALPAHVRGNHVADVGSGVGLPGVVLASLRPDWQVALLEPRGKRARFLAQVCIELSLPNTQALATRVEQWRPVRRPDTIVSQAVGSMQMLFMLTRHLHAPGVRLIAMKGEDPAPEVAGLPPGPFAVRVEAIAVPGHRARHLVIVDW